MPDPTRATISSTEVSALFGISPWVTEWMLYQRFRNGVDIDKPEDERMLYGKWFQGRLLDLVGRELRLDVEHYPEAHYQRRGVLGASFDGRVTCPTRGRGQVETKWVDYRRFRETFVFDESDRCVAGPPYYELQLQIQLHVAGVDWGVIATMVGGNDLVLLERVPDDEIIGRANLRAETFLKRVAAGDEPEITSGEDLAIVERLVGSYYPHPPLDLSDDAAGDDLEDLVLEYEHVRDQRLELCQREKELKARALRSVQDLSDVEDQAPATVFCRGGTVKVSHTPETPQRKASTRISYRELNA